MATAILIDGDFFIRRLRFLVGKRGAVKVANDLHWMCREHLKPPDGKRDLYRIFFYDCPPLTKKAHNPISRKAADFSTTPTAIWRTELHHQLRCEIQVLHRNGDSTRHIGEMTHHHRKTISNVLAALASKATPAGGASGGQPARLKRPGRRSTLEPFKEFLLGGIKEGVSMAELLLELRGRGFTGSRQAFQRFLRASKTRTVTTTERTKNWMHSEDNVSKES